MRAKIRRASPGDEHALSLIGTATFLETYAGVLDAADIGAHCVVTHSPSAYAERLADPAWRLWLAEAETGHAPVGFVSLGPPMAQSAGDVEIHRLYVLAPFYGRKVGAGLLREAVNAARELNKKRLIVGVNALNKAGVAFYEEAGFARVGMRKFTVGATKHDDVVLGLAL